MCVNAVRAVIKHNLSILSLLTQSDQLHSISITTFGKLHKYFWLLKISHLSIEINLMEASQFTAVGSCGLHDLFKLLNTNNICVCMEKYAVLLPVKDKYQTKQFARWVRKNKIYHWSDPDEFDRIYEPLDVKSKKIHVVDSGLTYNLPYPLILRLQRGVDLIISFDFSARPSDSSPPFKVKRDFFCGHKWFMYTASLTGFASHRSFSSLRNGLEWTSCHSRRSTPKSLTVKVWRNATSSNQRAVKRTARRSSTSSSSTSTSGNSKRLVSMTVCGGKISLLWHLRHLFVKAGLGEIDHIQTAARC